MLYQFKSIIIIIFLCLSYRTVLTVISDCSILTATDLGSNSSFSRDGLLADSLNSFHTGRQNFMYWIVDFNIICLSQGSSKNKYSSSSVAVAYVVKNEDNPSQRIGLFHFRCFNFNWTLNLITAIHTTIASSNLMNFMKYRLKERCWICTELIKDELSKNSDDHCLGK